MSKTQTTSNLPTQFKATFRKNESKAFFEGQHTDATMGTAREPDEADRLHPRNNLTQHPRLGQQVCAFLWMHAAKQSEIPKTSSSRIFPASCRCSQSRSSPASQVRVLVTTEPKTSPYNVQRQRDEPRRESSLCYQRHLYSILLFAWQGYK